MNKDNDIYINKYFQILNIERNSTIEEIKKKYKSLVLKHHPDKRQFFQENDDEETMKEINIAYEEVMKYKQNVYEQTNNKTDDINMFSEIIFEYIHIFNYIFTNALNIPKDIIIDMNVGLIDLYNKEIKKIVYIVNRGINNNSKEKVFIDLCNYQNQYVFKGLGDENQFTKKRSDLIINLRISYELCEHISIKNILDDFELIYNMKINLYEYFYGVNRKISYFDEILHIEYNNIYSCDSLKISQKGLTFIDENDNEQRGDFIIFFNVDLSYNNITNDTSLIIKRNIKEYFDI